jgi:hypothetical protein
MPVAVAAVVMMVLVAEAVELEIRLLGQLREGWISYR